MVGKIQKEKVIDLVKIYILILSCQVIANEIERMLSLGNENIIR